MVKTELLVKSVLIFLRHINPSPPLKKILFWNICVAAVKLLSRVFVTFFHLLSDAVKLTSYIFKRSWINSVIVDEVVTSFLAVLLVNHFQHPCKPFFESRHVSFTPCFLFFVCIFFSCYYYLLHFPLMPELYWKKKKEAKNKKQGVGNLPKGPRLETYSVSPGAYQVIGSWFLLLFWRL